MYVFYCDLIGHVCQLSINKQQHEQSHEIMCYVCCKELKGWCKSFTRTEGCLSVLEAVLLVALISFLVFLILHFVACRKHPEITTEKTPDKHTLITDPIITSTLSPDVECTWEPSRPTAARTHYYLPDNPNAKEKRITTPLVNPRDEGSTSEAPDTASEPDEPADDYDDTEFSEQDRDNAGDIMYKSQVVALVKLKPPAEVTFGCILTKITKYWTLTAASCIESIEEVDSLDSFVILEDYGETRQSRPRAVSDVQIHPFYQGANRSYDLAALRSERALRGWALLPGLAGVLDYFLLAVGERLTIVGYGGYRTVDRSPAGRRLRRVSVYVVSGAQCAGAGGLWAPRHLAGGAALRHGECGAAPLCAGARYSRGSPCNYCAGTPLLRAGTLFGIMSDNAGCAVSCEPQLYVNIATLRDWIDSVME